MDRTRTSSSGRERDRTRTSSSGRERDRKESNYKYLRVS